MIYQKCTEDSFYRLWIEFLAPFHKLTNKERDVAARILMQYFRLKESIDDVEVLKDVLWSRKSKKDMMDSLKMSQAYFQMTVAKLKSAGFLLNDEINPRYIPHKGDSPCFVMQVYYDWSSPDNPIKR